MRAGTSFGGSSLPVAVVVLITAACGPGSGDPAGSAAPGTATHGASPGDWGHYGRDAGGGKYVPLDQIRRDNVADLVLAWSWDTGEEPIVGPRRPVRGQDVRPGNFEATPLVVNDTMYLSTPYNRVVALDAGSGRELWAYDPRTVDWGQPPNGTGLVHRGVALWTGDGERRAFLNTRWRLIALDAATGLPIETFGHRGEVDLTERLVWPTNRLHYTQTSPPLVFEDLVIIGNGVWDGFVYPQDPPGNVQAFDARTGELIWSFNLIPQAGEPGNETWLDGSAAVTGHTNAWAPMVADEELGLVFVPVGTPSNDYYGGHRLGDNLYAESLLALDARTGEHVWHFQTVHHGLWDFDVPGAPALFTHRGPAGDVQAVAVASKTGFVYAFDRATGEPLWPIEERPVPGSDVPGEQTARTQPFPTRPPAFARQGMTPDDLVNLSPALNRAARELVAAYELGGLFAPPSLRGTVHLPGILGGANWGGVAIDPTTGLLYVKSSDEPSLLAVAEGDPDAVVADYALDRTTSRTLRVDGFPVVNPPYGTVTAIDMHVGEIVWQSPVGDQPDLRARADARGIDLGGPTGVVGAPGPIVTAGGLVFVTGGSDALHAFDAATGTPLWRHDLGARGYANPMSYATSDGRQFVAIATGGRDQPARLLVFALDGSAP